MSRQTENGSRLAAPLPRNTAHFAQRLIDSFPDLIVALDRDGVCTFVGERCKELLGYAPEDLVGSRLADRLDPRDGPNFEAWIESIRSSAPGEPGGIDLVIESQSGEMRLFRSTAGPLLGELGEVEGLIVSLRDVTDSKRIEQQLIQSERLAAMGQMVAGAAHELNNPLTAILGITEVLKDSLKDDAMFRHVDLVHGQARRAALIVQSLLSFARPSHPRKTRLQLGDVIERSLQFQEGSLQSNNITVDFPRTLDTATVLGDAGQLTQVCLNLIINAEQAIREVRDHGTLRIRVATLGDNVIATFEDDGAGIRRDILPKIFDPFFTTKRPGRGTGLGLSISLAILREHLGAIQAQSAAGGGAVFTLSLPVARGKDLILADPLVSRATGAPAGSLSGCSLLVVDDEESIREMVRDGLASRGVRVDAAYSGEEALCMLESRSYDLVLSDLNLKASVPSAISGLDFYARASRLAVGGQGPVFVFMTGELVEQTSIKCSDGQSIRTLQKPFRISELAKLLTDVLAHAPARTA